MKKFIFILCILLFANCAFSSQYSSTLDKLENSLYGFTYADGDEARLTRLEQSIYGEGKKGKSVSERITALNKDMSADSIGKEIAPKEDTFAEEEIYTPEERLARNSIPPAGANVDYPSINELEQNVFKEEHKNQDITARLTNLEKKVFGKSFDSEPFSSRVERLQAKVKPHSFMNNSIAQSSNSFFDDNIIPLEKDYTLEEYSTPDFDYESYNKAHTPPAKINIASVEKHIFKKSFNNEKLETRLSRLESTMFGTTFESDSQQDRLNRIASAYKATKTANKYDSNKFTQNMAAATQIGMLILMILACVL